MKTPNHKNVHYGELVKVASLTGIQRNYDKTFRNYHSGMKIHYFNKKGVFLGNLYEFVSYDRIQFRENSPSWCRNFMTNSKGNKRSAISEFILQSFYELKCRIITVLIRSTYYD